MAGMDWFRWHHGSVTDPKFQLIAKKTNSNAAEVIAVWAVFLEAASQSEERGRLGKVDFEAIDCLLGLDEGQTDRIHAAMTERGLLECGLISRWEKRQPKREREDNTSTERSRNSRARKSAMEACNTEAQIASAEAASSAEASPSDASNTDATPCNATQHQNQHGSTSTNQETPREEKSREEEIRETKEGSATRKRSAPPPARPDDVTEQVWADWMALRKAKRAPVSETVLSGARSEATKAFLSLDRFLAIWCTRGSQGLQADWLRPEECGRPVASQQRPVAAEPAWRTEQRLRMQQAAPGVAARPMTQPQQPDFIDVEAHDAHAARLA
ncbi:hypothetical protein [Curvibacter lanceolatus]|uniref:hypothetical protein n=1 Tax=Curvibacter lanceolatus TaxID=86182 RepID=UPI0003767346|nr:hypothetical protein [Curvibacter lanceolatus]